MQEKKRTVLFLFDVDGTLTPSREKATEEMKSFLGSLRQKALIGFVGGSDLAKQKEQLGDECIKMFDYWFPENGLHYIKNGEEISSQSYIEYVGEKEHVRLVNKIMESMSKIDIPVKRGNFIEFRKSMVNVSPVGRSCSRKERKEFCALDKKEKIREKIVNEVSPHFKNLTFSIGGEISIDIFPTGWDKTYCLNHLEKEGVKEIYFFGDMIHVGGNDYEIAQDPRVIATTVSSPQDTIAKVSSKLKDLGI